MMLALVLALMMAAAILAVLWPLSRGREAVPGEALDAAPDIAVYRDQLEEIERDRSAGAIGADEAQAAQVEVSRRLLAAARPSGSALLTEDIAARRFRRRATALAALVLMPAGAALVYLAVGSPGLPGQALADRSDMRDNSLPAMIAKIESHLEQNPTDGRGWAVVAPVYLRLGRFDDAVRADRNAIKYLGESPARLGDLGEALVSQANGVITGEAKALFEKAAAADAKDARAQFYLGLAAEQDGRREDAAKTWRVLITQAPADAPWLPAVKEALARVDGTPPPTAPGPSAEDIAVASGMSADDREKMVRGMVDRLSQRLHEDGSDVDGWLRLMRAHVVLGEREKASETAADARRALKDAPDKLRQIDDGAKSFGLGG
jgi:cytochrome c-type biogenesis protein CcmH